MFRPFVSLARAAGTPRRASCVLQRVQRPGGAGWRGSIAEACPCWQARSLRACSGTFSSSAAGGAPEGETGASSAAPDASRNDSPTLGSSADHPLVLYRSRDPMLVKGAAAILSAQAISTVPVGGFIAYNDILSKGAMTFAEIASTDGLKIAAALGLLGIVSQFASYRILRFVVTRIEVYAEDGAEWVTFTRLGMFRNTRFTVPREAVEGAAPGAGRVSCEVKHAGGGTSRYYLLPNDWGSDDQTALKRLLYEPYFLPSKPQPPIKDLMAVEGFGDFRPAQIADPKHPAAQALTGGQEQQLESGQRSEGMEQGVDEDAPSAPVGDRDSKI